MNGLITLKFFRNIQGVRTPYIMTLDASRNLVDERVDADLLPAALRDAQAAPVEVGADVTRRLELLRQWFDPDAPNPLPGTDGIRERCHKQIADAINADCTSCELNSIKSEYRALLENSNLI